MALRAQPRIGARTPLFTAHIQSRRANLTVILARSGRWSLGDLARATPGPGACRPRPSSRATLRPSMETLRPPAVRGEWVHGGAPSAAGSRQARRDRVRRFPRRATLSPMPRRASDGPRNAARSRRAVRRKPRLAADEIVCRLCHGVYRAITTMHLRAAHGRGEPSSVPEYKARFQLRVACSRETRRRTRNAAVALAARRGVRWSRASVLAQLGRRARAQRSLAPSRVPPTLYAAACRLFGSWRKALEKAGLEPTDHLVRGRWSRERVLEEVRRLHGEGRPLTATKVKLYARSLWLAAARHVGSWGEALRAAGLDAPQGREPGGGAADPRRDEVRLAVVGRRSCCGARSRSCRRPRCSPLRATARPPGATA